MARLPALVSALAATDGRDRATIDLIARTVREAGLMSSGKPGRGASEMTVSDAVNLILGANTVQYPKLAAVGAMQFRTLKQAPHGRRATGPVFESLAKADTLADAVKVLINEAPALSSMGMDGIFGKLEVTFSNGIAAEIRIMRPGESGAYETTHYWVFTADVNLFKQGFYTLFNAHQERRVSTTIGIATFLSINAALFGTPTKSPGE